MKMGAWTFRCISIGGDVFGGIIDCGDDRSLQCRYSQSDVLKFRIWLYLSRPSHLWRVGRNSLTSCSRLWQKEIESQMLR
jgi:hypothetical protein